MLAEDELACKVMLELRLKERAAFEKQLNEQNKTQEVQDVAKLIVE